MEWKVLIGFQAIVAALMVLVCGSLLPEVGKDSSLTLLSRWVKVPPSSSGITIDVDLL